MSSRRNSTAAAKEQQESGPDGHSEAAGKRARNSSIVRHSSSLSAWQDAGHSDLQASVLDAIHGNTKPSESVQVHEVRKQLLDSYETFLGVYQILHAERNRHITKQEWLQLLLDDKPQSDTASDAESESGPNEQHERVPDAKDKKNSKSSSRSESRVMATSTFRRARDKGKSEKPDRVRRRKSFTTMYKSKLATKVLQKYFLGEFKSIDANHDGVIDQFEFLVYFLVHDLDLQWTRPEISYRMTLYRQILRRIFPTLEKSRKRAEEMYVDVNMHKLQEHILQKKRHPKLVYFVWKFVYENFGGQPERMLLTNPKRLSVLDVLAWFIGLQYDPFNE